MSYIVVGTVVVGFLGQRITYMVEEITRGSTSWGMKKLQVYQ
ncbi:uncharacterized protein METZ01_LOCUS274381 [marine metagenome]|uniref:Uncharacterized protein n=1 Tax=marine metagenome TaxID=408172 RepID=A0A382KEX0_9ZZZZ